MNYRRRGLNTKINIWILNLGYCSLIFGLAQFDESVNFYGLVPFMLLSFSLAAWLFYIQHTFENTLWQKQSDFHNSQIAIRGSSFYSLPRFLNWVTANIGYHHVHHVDTQIPLYHLAQAHQEVPFLKNSQTIDLRQSFKSHHLKLWDEDQKKLVGF